MKNDLNNFTPDPALEALLDEALSVDSIPGGLPAGLSDRIFAATRAELAAGRARPTVLGRIGMPWPLAVAASVLLLVGGALWLGVQSDVGVPARSWMAHNPSAISPTGPTMAFDEVDRELDLLSVQVEQFADNTHWNTATAWSGDAIEDLDFQTDAAVF
jgi:hypothetical protein